MLRKSIIGIIVTVVVCVGFVFAFNKYDSQRKQEAQQQYDYNISTNDKPVGQNAFKEFADIEPISSFDDLINLPGFREGGIIVEGEVVSKGVLAYDGFPKVAGTPDDHELNIKDKVEVTLTQFKVKRVLYGKLDTDIITVYQFGPPNTDLGELKVREEQKLICFLRKADYEPFDENTYGSVSWENGFYDISDEDRTRAFSNVNGLCRYDDRPSKDLIKEIESAVKRKKQGLK